MPSTPPPARPLRVTVVCTGNICRSPMGEVILRALLKDAGLDDAVEVDSAGTDSWHVGDPADPRTVAALRRHGYDGTTHVASQITAARLAEADLVLAADAGHLRALRRLARADAERGRVHLLRSFDPEAVAAGDVETDDPWYGGADDFERCLTEVEAACRGVVADLRTRLGSAGDGPVASPS